MDKIYEHHNENFVVKQDDSKCEYTVQHTEWAEPILAVHFTQDSNPNTYRWAAKGPTVSIGTDGSFQSTLDACCNHIISRNSKGPTIQDRCQEGQSVFENL